MVFVTVDCKRRTPELRGLVYATIFIAVMTQNFHASNAGALKDLELVVGVSDYPTTQQLSAAVNRVKN
jgi:hypothetical protein